MIKRYLEAKKKNVNIDVKNPGVLEIPEDKKFWELPLSHFEKLVDKKGYAKIIRALTNLEVWNKNDNPDISKKASDIADKLKKKFKKENLNRNESFEDIPQKELFDLLENTKIGHSIDREINELRDDTFKTHYDKYPVKTLSVYTIIPVETFNKICRDTAYTLTSVLGDFVGDFIDSEEYYRETLKDFNYLIEAQRIIKKLDEDSYFDSIEKVIDDFKYNGQEYIILEVE